MAPHPGECGGDRGVHPRKRPQTENERIGGFEERGPERNLHPCGNEKILALGLCATCYTLKRQDTEYFGGLREQVLERDGYACRVCGDPDPGVHHREPSKSLLHLMIALCAGCHAKVYRTKVVLTAVPPLLLELWREQHPEGHEQMYIDFNVRKPPAQSVPLNFEPAPKD
jgi:hypothetical protein